MRAPVVAVAADPAVLVPEEHPVVQQAVPVVVRPFLHRMTPPVVAQPRVSGPLYPNLLLPVAHPVPVIQARYP